MQLKVFFAAAFFPTEIHAAEDHPMEAMTREHVLQPSVRFQDVDLGELTWEVGHAAG